MIGAIIQARMNSSRLPGKVMMRIKDKSILEYVIEQVTYSKKINKIIIATTIHKNDDIVSKFARTKNLLVFRGSEDDVLDRYYKCAKKYELSIVVRITSDNPLIDPEIVDKVVEKFECNIYDYVSTEHPTSFPQGFAVEVFSFNALEKAWKNAKKRSEREHVTPYFYNNPKIFSLYNIKNDNDLSNIRCTLDRGNDYEFIKNIIERIDKRPINLKDVLYVLSKDPELINLNKNNIRNEGYLKSVKEDNCCLK